MYSITIASCSKDAESVKCSSSTFTDPTQSQDSLTKAMSVLWQNAVVAVALVHLCINSVLHVWSCVRQIGTILTTFTVRLSLKVAANDKVVEEKNKTKTKVFPHTGTCESAVCNFWTTHPV